MLALWTIIVNCDNQKHKNYCLLENVLLPILKFKHRLMKWTPCFVNKWLWCLDIISKLSGHSKQLKKRPLFDVSHDRVEHSRHQKGQSRDNNFFLFIVAVVKQRRPVTDVFKLKYLKDNIFKYLKDNNNNRSINTSAFDDLIAVASYVCACLNTFISCRMLRNPSLRDSACSDYCCHVTL